MNKSNNGHNHLGGKGIDSSDFEQENRRPLEELHGLSLEQLHWMLYFPFDSPGLVRFPEVLDTHPVSPVLDLFALLLHGLGEKGLKATAKGNLPRNFCREAAEHYLGEKEYKNFVSDGEINREIDFLDLHIAHVLGNLAGLIRKYKGRIIISRKCHQLIDKSGSAAIYPKLFSAYVKKFKWGYMDYFPELSIIQDCFLFSLYLLSRYSGTWQSTEFYEDKFLSVFPIPPDEINVGFSSPDKIARLAYTMRTMTRFCDYMGLAKIEREPDKSKKNKYRVKSLPLLEYVVQFQTEFRDVTVLMEDDGLH
ncbi:MAG: hypothetical protein OXD01_09465 [Gammaproteobacteria bacterium]|nr:hypothetical protein [Gammaproteobacteria bacterium]